MLDISWEDRSYRTWYWLENSRRYNKKGAKRHISAGVVRSLGERQTLQLIWHTICYIVLYNYWTTCIDKQSKDCTTCIDKQSKDCTIGIDKQWMNKKTKLRQNEWELQFDPHKKCFFILKKKVKFFNPLVCKELIIKPYSCTSELLLWW